MAKLTIEVPAEEFDAAIKNAYNKNKNKFSIPGFRKGKAPLAMLEKMYGAGIFYEDAANEVIDASYPKAAEESKEEIVSTPEIKVTQIEKGKAFIYEATVALKPEVTLGEYKGVEVEKAKPEVTDADVEAGHTDAEGYKGIFQQMMKEFGFKYVVSTLRESFSATHNGWKAMIYNGEEFYTSKRYDIDPIIDRVGGGDSFSGGIIHGLLTKPNQGAALEFAVAASALKHTINGDFNLVSVEEVEALAGGDASGRVQR